MTDDELLSFIRNYEDPCLTASELSDEFDLTNDAINYRLYKLKDAGKLETKSVGASARVWYVTG